MTANDGAIGAPNNNRATAFGVEVTIRNYFLVAGVFFFLFPSFALTWSGISAFEPKCFPIHRTLVAVITAGLPVVVTSVAIEPAAMRPCLGRGGDTDRNSSHEKLIHPDGRCPLG